MREQNYLNYAFISYSYSMEWCGCKNWAERRKNKMCPNRHELCTNVNVNVNVNVDEQSNIKPTIILSIGKNIYSDYFKNMFIVCFKCFSVSK